VSNPRNSEGPSRRQGSRRWIQFLSGREPRVLLDLDGTVSNLRKAIRELNAFEHRIISLFEGYAKQLRSNALNLVSGFFQFRGQFYTRTILIFMIAEGHFYHLLRATRVLAIDPLKVLYNKSLPTPNTKTSTAIRMIRRARIELER
jgi:hypothetical protein